MSSGISAKMVVKGLANFRKELKSFDDHRRKAGEIAVRVEAFRLRKVMKKELRGGGIAGHKFKAKRVISRDVTSSRKKVLGELHHGVRYWYRPKGTYKVMSVGFTQQRITAMDGSTRRTAKTWYRLAAKHQQGFEVNASQPHYGVPLRLLFVRRGNRYAKNKQYFSLRRFFFIKKSTTKFKTPARPIVEPFWRYHKSGSEKNIISNFNRKLRGDRI